ncbi:hypothetical protein ACFOSS_01090 [Pseudaeromonas sharmana]|uniref:Zinc ribbon family protein n=1 Tax=Pseudaeromonas sharmana TaxID=328412 RepID=A0ABV8CJH8_9GAMM
MPRQQQAYEVFIQRLKQEWQDADPGASLQSLLEKTQAYLEAAGELTRDEWALIREYVRRDLQDFDQAPGGYRDSAFYQALQTSVWGWLLELTDRTQVEWISVLDEVQHKGVFLAGERMGLGVLVCEQCGYRREVLHPERIVSCIQCGGTRFHREPLAP